jgi:Rieske Fe-S protein
VFLKAAFLERVSLKRRGFLRFLGGWLIFGLAACLGCRQAAESLEPRWVKLGPLTAFKEGANHFPLERLMVWRAGNSFRALSMVCTHQNCIVGFTKDSSHGEFVCPCHGSRFDIQGRVLTPPAQLPLHRLEVKERGNEIYVRLS